MFDKVRQRTRTANATPPRLISFSTINGTEQTVLCCSAVKQLLTHSLTSLPQGTFFHHQFRSATVDKDSPANPRSSPSSTSSLHFCQNCSIVLSRPAPTFNTAYITPCLMQRLQWQRDCDRPYDFLATLIRRKSRGGSGVAAVVTTAQRNQIWIQQTSDHIEQLIWSD